MVMSVKVLYRNVWSGATFWLEGPPEVQARMGASWKAQR